MKPVENGSATGGKTVFAAGAVGVLVGLKRLLKPSKKPKDEALQSTDWEVPGAETEMAAPVEPKMIEPNTSELSESQKAARNFSIKRTKSEVGYVYWILEGYGKYKCFVLCDSWDEAVAQAKARLAAAEGEDSEAATVGERAGGVLA